jgi:hypothetical protein
VSSSCGSVRIDKLDPWLDPTGTGPATDDEVTLSRKGAKSRSRVRRLRSAGTKTATPAGRRRQPRADLEQQLERIQARTVQSVSLTSPDLPFILCRSSGLVEASAARSVKRNMLDPLRRCRKWRGRALEPFKSLDLKSDNTRVSTGLIEFFYCEYRCGLRSSEFR